MKKTYYIILVKPDQSLYLKYFSNSCYSSTTDKLEKAKHYSKLETAIKTRDSLVERGVYPNCKILELEVSVNEVIA